MSQENKQSVLVVHGLGGCGINITDSVFSKIADLGDGFAKLKFHYFDTSRANIDKINPRGEFWMVKTKSFGKGEINGSGGERGKHSADSQTNIKEYLDANKYIKRETGEFHCVVASASGGSGSTSSVLLIRELLSRNIPAFAVVIGDSSNALSAKNTKNTLASLNAVAKSIRKPITLVYVNNHTLAGNGIGLKEAEKRADQVVFNTMTTISMFLSGLNEDLDYQDMAGIIDQSHYSTIQIDPGLFGLTVYSKKINIPEGAIPTVGRTVTLPETDFDTTLTLLHHKKGYITSKNAIDIIKPENFPIHMLAYANFFKLEERNLDKIVQDYENIMASIRSEDISGCSTSSMDDETGLIF